MSGADGKPAGGGAGHLHGGALRSCCRRHDEAADGVADRADAGGVAAIDERRPAPPRGSCESEVF